MARDIELARKILLAIDSSELTLDSSSIRIAGYTPEQIAEQIQQLKDAHLLDGISASGDGGQRWVEVRLTWAGYEFLDAARDESIWRAAVGAMHDQDADASFEAWQAMLIKLLFEVYRAGKQLS